MRSGDRQRAERAQAGRGGREASPWLTVAPAEDVATLAFRLVTLALLGLSVAWWLVDPGFEPVITGVAAVAGLVSAGAMSTSRRGREGGAATAPETSLPTPRVDPHARALSFTATPHTVGRQGVVDVLERQLEACRKSGRGRMVCVTGEAGIGKTTVAENFLAGLDRGAATVARGRCSERLAGAGAYLPLIEALESLLRGPAGEEHAEVMARTAPSWFEQLGPAAGGTGSEGEGTVSQERLKRDLTRFCEHLTRSRPFVLLLEDLHWADVSTVDLLTYLADRFDGTATLVLATYRPEEMRLGDHAFLRVRPTLEQRGHLHEIPLDFLAVEEVARYVALEYPRHAFPADFARALHARTEGSPLFVVALLRDLERQDVIAENDGGVWVLTRSIGEVERDLPATLAAMIERKTERLEDADGALLGVAAVQGVRFDAVVVAESLGVEVVEVEDRLARLARDHRLVSRVDDAALPDGTVTVRYEFVHVLYQHGLLDSIGPATRVAWSRRVAEALIEHHGEAAVGVAAEIGLLFEAARELERAATYLQTATAEALRVSAPTEAVALCRKALEVVGAMPPGPERDLLELRVTTDLGSALMRTEGWGAPPVIDAYRRARELAARTGEVLGLPRLILQGMWYRWTTRQDLSEVPGLINDLHAVAERTGDPSTLLHAHWMEANLLFWRGHAGAARPIFEEALRQYAPGQDDARFVYGQDPYIAASSYASWNLCLAGFPDRALSAAEACLAAAEKLDHPFTTCYGLMCTTWVSILRRDPRGALEQAERTLELAEQHAFPFHLSFAGVQRAWALAHQGSPGPALEEMSRYLARNQEMGAVLCSTFFLALVADIRLLVGSPKGGLEAVDRALALEDEIEEWTFAAELRRLRGELLRLAGGDPKEVEACYRSALDVAGRQQSRWLGLRAAVSLGRLLREQGRTAQGREVLLPAYEGFTEGFDTRDLGEARELLAALDG